LLLGLISVGLMIDHFIIPKFQGKLFLYSVTSIGNFVSIQHSPDFAVSDALRGLPRQSFDFLSLFKKIFYNLYNFYKLLPQIMNPYLFALFAIGLFTISHKDSKFQGVFQKSFKIASLFMVLLTFLVTAAGIPFFRYLHPIVPLVYIIGTETLVKIIYNLQIAKRNFLTLGSIMLFLILAVGQTLGVLLLDSRFDSKAYNVGKPPVYVELSRILKENTHSNQTIVTNLDTWGSWYGERKTVWFPLTPKQLINPKTGEIPFDAIYLTSYKIEDPNYYIGEGWRLIFENPKDKTKWSCEGCDKIAEEFDLKDIYFLKAENNYEREKANAILLVKN